MLPSAFFQVMSLIADLVLFIFVGYYLLRLHTKEKDVEKREKKIDTDYHQVVDDALTKERKILDDATQEAEHIIADTQFVSQESKGSIDAALAKMKKDIEHETAVAAQEFRNSYQKELEKIANQSLTEFHSISKELQDSLHKEVMQFHSTLLPSLQKELDEYKQARLKQTEQTIKTIVQKASQEVLNKSLSTDDHQKILIDALDKAKREGMFD